MNIKRKMWVVALIIAGCGSAEEIDSSSGGTGGMDAGVGGTAGAGAEGGSGGIGGAGGVGGVAGIGGAGGVAGIGGEGGVGGEGGAGGFDVIAPDPLDPNGTIDPDFVNPRVGNPSGAYRNIDGTGNNETYFELGAADTVVRRLAQVDYGDGISSLAGEGRRSAREISNAVSAATGSILNPFNASDFLWQWGQFIDHDIAANFDASPPIAAPIPVPQGDLFFDPLNTGLEEIHFDRSLGAEGTGHSLMYPLQHTNQITHFIDGSQVYGSDEARALALRVRDGSGRLRVSAGRLPPFNISGFPNFPDNSPDEFFAGDFRVAEQVALTTMHTLFIREHNRQVRRLAEANPSLTGEQLYQEARRMVGGIIQVITYREFLPALLGPNALPVYTGYKPDVNPALFDEFATGVYRFGHTFLSPQLLLLDENLEPVGDGFIPLRDTFFNPQFIIDNGIEPLLRGLANQVSQRFDAEVIDDVRNFLFGPPGAGGFDLVALNIQRGRDHGLPGYNDVREAAGLARKTTFAEINGDPVVQARLRSVYDTVDDIDLWIGMASESPVNGGNVGELAFTIATMQFANLRDGDRYFYLSGVFSPSEVAELENTLLSDVIRRNTPIGKELQDDVFHVVQ